MTVADWLIPNKILRGRKEIAREARVSTGVLDKLIDQGIIEHTRWGGGQGGTIYTTSNLILQAVERSAKKRGRA